MSGFWGFGRILLTVFELGVLITISRYRGSGNAVCFAVL